MRTRALVLLVAVSAIAAEGQELSIGAEVDALDEPGVAAEPDAGPKIPEVLDAGPSASMAFEQARSSQPQEPTQTTATEAERFRFRGTLPEGFHLVSERRVGLLATGMGLFLAAYLVPAVWAMALGEARGLIPIAGAVYWAARLPGDFTSSAFRPSERIVPAALLGSAQVAGIVLLAAGLLTQSRWLDRRSA